jgi:hypothetical protein
MYRFAAAACVGAMLTGCSSEAGTTNAGPAEPEAALDGSYVVEWDGTGTKNGAPADDLNKSGNGWAHCRPGQPVGTAEKRSRGGLCRRPVVDGLLHRGRLDV